MKRKFTTLKDIAEVCNVTSTLVSAVLNNRNGNISCSDAKRELILKTAEKMCYKANFFARSMKIDHVPIVGLALHLETHDNIGELSMYVNSCLSHITSALNNYKIEVSDFHGNKTIVNIPLEYKDEIITGVVWGHFPCTETK